MDKVEVVLNTSEIGDFLKSDEVINILKKRASKIQSRAGEGYKTKILTKKAVAIVQTDKSEKVRDNMKNNTLIKALR